MSRTELNEDILLCENVKREKDRDGLKPTDMCDTKGPLKGTYLS